MRERSPQRPSQIAEETWEPACRKIHVHPPQTTNVKAGVAQCVSGQRKSACKSVSTRVPQAHQNSIIYTTVDLHSLASHRTVVYALQLYDVNRPVNREPGLPLSTAVSNTTNSSVSAESSVHFTLAVGASRRAHRAEMTPASLSDLIQWGVGR